LYPIVWGYYRRLLLDSSKIPKPARPYLNGLYELQLLHPHDDIDPFDFELITQNAKHLKSFCIDTSPKIFLQILAQLRNVSLPNLEKLTLDLVPKNEEPTDTNIIWIPLFSKTRNLRHLVLNDMTRGDISFVVDAVTQFCPSLKEFTLCGSSSLPSLLTPP
jgi:hypothetical protein